jgi:urease accessory protein UreE
VSTAREWIEAVRMHFRKVSRILPKMMRKITKIAFSIGNNQPRVLV